MLHSIRDKNQQMLVYDIESGHNPLAAILEDLETMRLKMNELDAIIHLMRSDLFAIKDR